MSHHQHVHGHSQSGANHSVLRTVSEDPRLRPFLSTHFDPTTFVASAVQIGGATTHGRQSSNESPTPNLYSKTNDPVSGTSSPASHANADTMLVFITTMIEDTNREIQAYISQHKDELMAGMQDIAMFADRCKVLHDWILQVQKSVNLLKAEVNHR